MVVVVVVVIVAIGHCMLMQYMSYLIVWKFHIDSSNQL